ncbi:MAG TPA: IS91 family transposase [Burkholderiales bacterium]|nr:IS91 family transposase [Burkholderiales bacterium]
MGAHPHADAAGARPELAHIFARHGAAYRATHPLVPVQYRAMRAIAACRTEALGGHVQQCDVCGVQRYTYHSCRNRHCPKCQTLAKERWLAARRAELLPVPYFHLVFTLPHALNALAQGNPRVLYGLLFETVSATLLEFGANPRWLGGEIAATLILHTWGQTLAQHLHLHCLVAAGALHADGHWVRSRRGFLFPVQALSQVFRGKFLAALTRAFDTGGIKLEGSPDTLAQAARARSLTSLRNTPWVVYAKQPFGGPQQVLDYLGRYTHRVALSNNRLVNLEHQQVSFRYKDSAHGNRRKVLTVEADEFIRRFLLHVLPRGFMRIRHYGLLANRAKRLKLAQARSALDHPAPIPRPLQPESVEAFWLRIASLDIHQCPHCHAGRMVLIASLHSHPARGPPALACA